MGLDAKLLRYAKAQAGAALAFPLGFFGTAVSLRAEVGALLPWGPGFASQPTCISDRCGPSLGEGSVMGHLLSWGSDIAAQSACNSFLHLQSVRSACTRMAGPRRLVAMHCCGDIVAPPWCCIDRGSTANLHSRQIQAAGLRSSLKPAFKGLCRSCTGYNSSSAIPDE